MNFQAIIPVWIMTYYAIEYSWIRIRVFEYASAGLLICNYALLSIRFDIDYIYRYLRLCFRTAITFIVRV